jgi:hypothetical protein
LGCVNESKGGCEQAVIPVADTKLTGEDTAKTGFRLWSWFC